MNMDIQTKKQKNKITNRAVYRVAAQLKTHCCRLDCPAWERVKSGNYCPELACHQVIYCILPATHKWLNYCFVPGFN